jgi:hypothetical protein
LNDDQIGKIIKDPEAVEFLLSPGYSTWKYYKQATIKNLPTLPSQVNYGPGDLEHLILGEYNTATEFYTGKGLHSPQVLKNAVDTKLVRVSFDGTINGVVSNLNDERILKDATTGVRILYIEDVDGQWKRKTIFPDEWSYSDIASGVAEASANKTSDTQFSKSVTRNGKTVTIKGTIIDGLIKTGFPIASFAQD